ncbi:MAG: acyl-CoA thioesterase [Flavobacteriales bacterium]
MQISGFNYVVPVQVRFADTDALGHVNNAVYLSYIEMARVIYFREVFGELIDWKSTGLILAKAEVNYKRPLYISDELHVALRTKSIGEKSFVSEYGLFVKKGDEYTLISTAETVLVCIDYTTGKTFAMPDSWRSAIFERDANPALQP